MLEEYPDILDVSTVMYILGISRTLLYELIHSGELPAKKIGNKVWRIRKLDLLNYLYS